LDRKIYDAMKERRISTLDLHAVLDKLGIVIPQRTLQEHLNNNFTKVDDTRLKSVALKMIENYDNFIGKMKEKLTC